MSTVYKIKEYTPEYKEKVFKLRRAVYNESFDDEEWEWKFKSSRILIATNDNDDVISLRPTVLLKLKFNDQEITAGMNVDVMTHPDYRRLGIFSDLVKNSFQMLKEAEVPIVYTFPNQFSFPGYIKRIKWSHTASIPLLVRVIKPENIIKSYFKNSTLINILNPIATTFNNIIFDRSYNLKNNDISVSQIPFFGKEFDILWYDLSKTFKISVIRDSHYLNWRYTERPGYDYKIFSATNNGALKGYMVLRNDEMFGLNLGLIVDLIAENDETCYCLINKAIEMFKKSEMDIVGCLMLENSPYFNIIKKSGFIKTPQRFSPKEFFFVNNVDEEKLDPEEAYSGKNWYITFGDIDIS